MLFNDLTGPMCDDLQQPCTTVDISYAACALNVRRLLHGPCACRTVLCTQYTRMAGSVLRLKIINFTYYNEFYVLKLINYKH